MKRLAACLAVTLLLFGGANSPAADLTYQIDDGTGENSVGLTAGGGLIWFNRFTLVPPFSTINSISVAFGQGIANGTALQVAIWSDPNGDGNPNDAVLLASANGVVANSNTDIYNTYAIAPTVVGAQFFVGAAIQQPAGVFPARLDQTDPDNGRSWVAGQPGGAYNIVNLNANALPPTNIDQLGLPGDWMVRANGTDGQGGGEIPEPSTIALLGFGALSLAGYTLRRRQKT